MSLTSAVKKVLAEIKIASKSSHNLTEKEAKTRKKWTDRYHRFLKNVDELINLFDRMIKRGLTDKQKEKAQSLMADLKNWRNLSAELTRERDAARAALRDKELELAKLRTEIEILNEQDKAARQADDQIVDQTFALNDVMVDARRRRDEFLTNNVFNQLIDEHGKLRRQLTIDSSDGQRRVVALVNSITIVKRDLATEAYQQVNAFFERIQPKIELDQETRLLRDLTKELLIETTNFKVGPSLYRFLGLSIDGDVFPELKKAQDLLKASLRSEKTTSYIRLYRRPSRKDKWQPVGQS